MVTAVPLRSVRAAWGTAASGGWDQDSRGSYELSDTL